MSVWSTRRPATMMRRVDDEPLISRTEVVTMLFMISDVALAARRLLEFIGGEDGGEEEEDDETSDDG